MLTNEIEEYFATFLGDFFHEITIDNEVRFQSC